VFKLGLMNQRCRLLARATKNQGPLARMQLLSCFLERKQPSSIERGHVAQTQDNHRRQLMDVLGDHRNFVSCSEQEWSVNAEDGGVVGNVLILENVNASIFDVVVGHF
jgi:hypothetical protein